MKRLCWHLALFGVILLGVRFGCPIYKVIGVPCPLCGTTRAWICFLSGEITKAFQYHPLFLMSPFWFFVAVHYHSLFKENRIIGVFLLCYAFALFAFHLLRMTGIVICAV